jgi:quercetin dioxygenase-like cupin family protein
VKATASHRLSVGGFDHVDRFHDVAQESSASLGEDNQRGPHVIGMSAALDVPEPLEFGDQLPDRLLADPGVARCDRHGGAALVEVRHQRDEAGRQLVTTTAQFGAGTVLEVGVDRQHLAADVVVTAHERSIHTLDCSPKVNVVDYFVNPVYYRLMITTLTKEQQAHFETPGGNTTTPLASPALGAKEVLAIQQTQAPGGSNPMHVKSGEALVVVLAGTVEVVSSTQTVSVAEGDAALIAPHTAHQLRNTGDTPARWLVITAANVRYTTPTGELIEPVWARPIPSEVLA